MEKGLHIIVPTKPPLSRDQKEVWLVVKACAARWNKLYMELGGQGLRIDAIREEPLRKIRASNRACKQQVYFLLKLAPICSDDNPGLLRILVEEVASQESERRYPQG